MSLASVDVALGLLTIYAALSALISALVEYYTAMTDRRALFLREGLESLLGKTLADAIWRHPLIAIRPGRRSPSEPSYIAPDVFTVVLMELALEVDDKTNLSARVRRRVLFSSTPDRAGIAGDATSTRLDVQARRVLTSFVRGARHRSEIEDRIGVWYRSGMERVSGVYKRRTQGLIMVVAALVVIAGHVDTFMMVNAFSTSPALRQVAAQTTQTDAPPSLAALKQRLETAGLTQFPFGWPRYLSLPADQRPRFATTVLGLIVTWLAIIIGGPYWFDLLKLFTNPRQTGTPPGGGGTRLVAH
jgi:hypothetical protein